MYFSNSGIGGKMGELRSQKLNERNETKLEVYRKSEFDQFLGLIVLVGIAWRMDDLW